jgi:hypothetical protein
MEWLSGLRALGTEVRRWPGWLPLLGLTAALCAGCSEKEKQDFFQALAAVAIVAMLGALVVVGIALLLLLLSLLCLGMNLAKPSTASVVGGVAFAGLFFLGGVGVGAMVIAHAATSQIAFEGALWILAHLVYAGVLTGSSVYGYQKKKRQGR